jgi:hypothetical protein
MTNTTEKLARFLDAKFADFTDWEFKPGHHTIAEWIKESALLPAPNDAALRELDMLRDLSSWLGMGLAPDATAEQLAERIREGVDMQVSVALDRALNVVEEASKDRSTTYDDIYREIKALASSALTAPSGEQWRPMTKAAIEKLGDAGQPFFASITVTNRITGATHIETPYLYLAERETEEGAMYYEAAVVGTGDETGWDIDDYEYFLPFNLPDPPQQLKASTESNKNE